ncbi:MAG: 30S ribosome-binding factor RbfA [Myxococcota bacterium]|nr:30S ribosome-binding factor RbfA [Myxococcota bacterium]
MTRRTERIGEQIRGELARLLREEVTDPRIGLVSVTRVDVSPDLRNARVHWSRLHADGDRDTREDAAGETAAGLASAAGFLRRRLARLLPTKRVPELRFVHDPSLALGSETLNLIRELDDGAS